MEGSLLSRPSVYFAIEKVLGVSSEGTYQVQWAPAWVSKFHLVGCEHLIQEFLQEQAEKVKTRVDQVLQENELVLRGKANPSDNTYLATQEDEPFCSTYSDSSENSPQGATSENHMEDDTLLNHADGMKVKIEIEEDLGESSSVIISIPENHSTEDTDITNNFDNELPTFSDLSTLPTWDSRRSHKVIPSSSGEYIVLRERQTSSAYMLKKQVCDVCGKRFRDKTDLNRHSRTHTGHKPHKCEICGKTFTLKANLNKHINVHNDDEHYTCAYCHQVCSNKFSFLEHVQTHNDGALDADVGKDGSQSSISDT